MKLFFSFKFGENDEFIEKLATAIRTTQADNAPSYDVYFDPTERQAGRFHDYLENHIQEAAALLFFVGKVIGSTQREELKHAIASKKIILPIYLPGYTPPGPLSAEEYEELRGLTSIEVKRTENQDAPSVYARKVLDLLRYGLDDLPNGYPFSYEKGIIAAYSQTGGPTEKMVQAGCPPAWPEVDRSKAIHKTPVAPKEIGQFRDCVGDGSDDDNPPGRDPRVLAAALTDLHPEGKNRDPFSFPEAGPRKWIAYHPAKTITVAILVSGGIAPGVNAVLVGLIKRQLLYADQGCWPCRIILYREGFRGLSETRGHDRILREYYTGNKQDRQMLDSDLSELSSLADSGGSYIPTSRYDVLLPFNHEERDRKLDSAVETLRRDGVQILYVVGGDGSMKGAHAIQSYAKRKYEDLAVFAIPKTMDNDVLWVWQSFGFLSAVQWAKDAIRQLYTETKSNPRLCVVQLFGSDSGFVVSHAALASGVCDYALIPELEYDLEAVAEHMAKLLIHRRISQGSPYGILLIAETALPRDATKYIDIPELNLSEKEKKAVRRYEANGRRLHGQTPDELRSASLKIIAGYMEKKIHEQSDDYWPHFRVFKNEPRHLIRSVRPSVADIVFGERLGSLAVDGAMAGYKDCMISQWLTEFVLVPLKLVVLGRKRIPTQGIFWRSVVAKTGQEDTQGT